MKVMFREEMVEIRVPFRNTKQIGQMVRDSRGVVEKKLVIVDADRWICVTSMHVQKQVQEMMMERDRRNRSNIKHGTENGTKSGTSGNIGTNGGGGGGGVGLVLK